MKRILCGLLGFCFLVYLSGCVEWRGGEYEPMVPMVTAPQVTLPIPTTASVHTPPTTVPTTVPPETEPVHSELYISGLSVETVIEYFNEICLDAEFQNGGNPALLQKWDGTIFYWIYGTYTDADLRILTGFMDWLNPIEGFPGICVAEEEWQTDLKIYFCSAKEMRDILGDHFVGMDGGVTFWYNGDNAIYDETICYRNDIGQTVRNSVILEEIYNGLGPVQDTDLRTDSIIYSGYSEPQTLTQIDELLLRLLYHPDMRCGMNAAECEAVIRSLYY